MIEDDAKVQPVNASFPKAFTISTSAVSSTGRQRTKTCTEIVKAEPKS